MSSSYTKYLLWTIVGGLCLVPFIAFIIANGTIIPSLFFPFITGKNFAFRILVEILVVLYGILALREPKYRPRASLIMWVVCAFVLWMAVATGLSVDPIKSFWSNFERMDGYITVLHLFALFIVGGAVLTASNMWKQFFQASVAASVLMGGDAVLQLMHVVAISSQSGSRVDTTFGNATYLAVYALFNIFITLLLIAPLLRTRDEIKRYTWQLAYYGVALVLEGITLYFTETRGAILGVVGGLGIAAIYIVLRSRGTDWQGLRRASMAGIAVIVLLVAGFFVVRNIPAVQNHGGTLSRLTSISLSDPTTSARLLYIWPTAIKGAMEKPITGWGQENFSYVFNKYYSPEMYSQEQWFDRAHNQFLDWLIAGGVPAFLLYFALFVLLVWAILRSDLSVPEQAVLLGLLAAYAFNNLFVFDNIMSFIYFYVLLAFVHGLSHKKLPGWLFLSKPASDQMVAVVAPIFAIVIVFIGWTFNAQPIARAQTLIDALETAQLVPDGNGGTTQAAKDPSLNLASFEKALTQGELGRQEVVEQMFQFASNTIAPSTSASPELKQEAYTATLAAGQQMLAQRKNDARLELFMAVFEGQFGQTAQAITYLQKALTDSPQKQQILFQLGVTYLQSGDTTDALATLKKAYDLEPAYDDARILYAIGLYSAGQTAAGDALLTARYNTVLVDDDKLLQTYTNLKMYDRVIGIWKLRVAASPSDVQTNLGLASAYFASGDTKDTIAQLQAIEKIDPTSAPQMASIISQIQAGTLKPGQQ